MAAIVPRMSVRLSPTQSMAFSNQFGSSGASLSVESRRTRALSRASVPCSS
jgi:hypothetical protein